MEVYPLSSIKGIGLLSFLGGLFLSISGLSMTLASVKVFGEHHKIVPQCFIFKFVKPKLRTHYSSPVQTSNHSRRRKFTLPKMGSSNTYYFLYRGQHWHFFFFDTEWPAWQVISLISHVIDVIEGSTGQTQLASILTF